jgi:hypothetical protein
VPDRAADQPQAPDRPPTRGVIDRPFAEAKELIAGLRWRASVS